ncbi:ribose-phosphate diphosphokinase [Halorubrum sp. CBA1125]|uniref:ribose-phosphate diphosphokinase n=1 Tax=Halorubrum sp. CBA1125 TaxID=2668072 RepID=UPI0012E8618A|nr:ribose-phosphate diphosphokinase [Halorubrum sp. CBA1125]MUW14547.1 ribose-phosphate diphosphokinase [Halorubrum sp. CBA1125]
MIVPGSNTQTFATALAKETGDELAHVEYMDFPDGEFIVRVPEELDRAIIVASMVSDRDHIEVLQLQDAAWEAGASEVITVLPYIGYSRQSEAFNVRQPVATRAMARAISTRADRVLTVNPHQETVCDFFDVPARPLDAAGCLAEPLPDDLSDPLFVSPGEDTLELATTVRDTYGRGTVDYFGQTRDYETDEVEIAPRDTVLTDRDVVLVDDIIATGVTMSESVASIQERDANRVFVSCVHLMLAGNALTKLSRKNVEYIYGTDTIEHAASDVSAASVVAEAL